MVFYFLMLALIYIFSLSDLLKISKASKTLISLLSLFLLICFFSFRFECDNDYSNYVGIYNNTPSLSKGITNVVSYGFLAGVEIGYCLVSAIFKTLNFIPQSIFIFSAILTFTVVHYCFRSTSVYPGLSMLIFFTQFFSLPFIQIRFGIAMAIVLLACLSLFKGNKFSFFLLIILGCLFHISALGGLMVFFFNFIDWTKRPYLILFAIISSLIIMLMPIRSLLISSLSLIDIGKYSELYADTATASPVSVIVTLIIILPLIFFRNQLLKKDFNVNAMLSMALCSIFVGCLVWQLGILNRFSMISASVLCLIIPSYLLMLKYKRDKFIGLVVIFGYCFLKFIPNLQHVLPYQTFFYHTF
jgi:hypothetical protein